MLELVQVMAWRRTGKKSLPEPMLTQFTDAYTLPAKSLEYSENTMETLAIDILIYCK